MKLDTYKHYKGKYYEVVGIAKQSETLEDLVVYYCLYPNKESQLWIRPLAMFQGKVIVRGKEMSRYTHIEDRNVLP